MTADYTGFSRRVKFRPRPGGGWRRPRPPAGRPGRRWPRGGWPAGGRVWLGVWSARPARRFGRSPGALEVPRGGDARDGLPAGWNAWPAGAPGRAGEEGGGGGALACFFLFFGLSRPGPSSHFFLLARRRPAHARPPHSRRTSTRRPSAPPPPLWPREGRDQRPRAHAPRSFFLCKRRGQSLASAMGWLIGLWVVAFAAQAALLGANMWGLVVLSDLEVRSGG